MQIKSIGELLKNGNNRCFEWFFHNGHKLFARFPVKVGRCNRRRPPLRSRFLAMCFCCLGARLRSIFLLTVRAVRENLDDAFARRFESIIYFPTPDAEQRLQLWENGFPPRAELSSRIDLPRIAEEHTLSGGAIMNVIRYASLRSLDRGNTTIELTRRQGEITLWRDWITFDTVEEAADYFNEHCCVNE